MSILSLRNLILVAMVIAMFQMPAAANTIRIQGVLSRTVEPGGWLIVANGKKYLVLNAKEFVGEPWFKAGMKVVATGEEKPDAVTTFQEGIPFQAATLAPPEGPRKC